MRIVLALVLGLNALACLAAPLDFARGRALSSEDDAFVHRVTLPADVYEWITRRDLGDVRVFDAAGEQVPYLIRRPETQDEYSDWRTVPLFPIPEAPADDPAGARIQVEVDDGGAIVAVNGRVASSEPGPAYLVDASGLDEAPTQMRLDWAGTTDFVGRIRIEGSDDLNDWRTIVASATVASLAGDGQGVRVDQLDLPRAKVKYLRLSQLAGSDRLELLRTELRHRSPELPETQWKRLTGEHVDDGFEFSSGGLFPVDRVRVEDSGGGNFLLTARLYSRAAPHADWRARGEHTFYRTRVDGIEASADPVLLSGGDQYWRVEPGEDGVIPELVIGWLPDELLYLAQGDPPYLMAYGQADTEGRQWPFRQLLEKLSGGDVDLSNAPLARVGDPETLGGPGRLEPAAEPVDWQTIVLWAVLVVGVVVVGGLAIRLLRSG
jgi:hypothetical protein